MAYLVAVNVGVAKPSPVADLGHTGIDKRPVAGPVLVAAPVAGSALAGDDVCDPEHHGGPDQAVYAYASEELATWAARLDRELPPGMFGENLTTAGVDVSGALIGERWQVGEVLLEVCAPRIPCRKFAAKMAEPRWVKRFTAAAMPGAYLRVLVGGQVRAGDPVAVVSRPDHEVTVATTFRALTTKPELLPGLLAAPALPAKVREVVMRRSADPVG